MDIMEVKGLTRKFGDFTAVDNISFMVKEGEIFGLLGPNGAGKSTAIKMLTTILNPTSGEANICGYDITSQKDNVRRNIGIVFQDSSVDTFLTGKDNLHYHGIVYHMNKKIREERISEVLELLDLKGKENTPLKDCSGGVQRRFEVARGFMSHPKVLFLDEPTIGLDINTRKTLWDYINRLREDKGVTIILTTHYIEESDHLCDRVSIIDHGKIAAIDSPRKLKDLVGFNRVWVETANGQGGRFVEEFSKLDWIRGLTQDGTILKMRVQDGEKRIPEILNIADQQGISISSVESIKPSLEDAFLHLTGETIREEGGNLQEFRRAKMRKRR